MADPLKDGGQMPGTGLQKAAKRGMVRNLPVTCIARRNERPGSAIIHGGAKVTKLTTAATTSAQIHGHESSFTRPQTSP